MLNKSQHRAYAILKCTIFGFAHQGVVDTHGSNEKGLRLRGRNAEDATLHGNGLFGEYFRWFPQRQQSRAGWQLDGGLLAQALMPRKEYEKFVELRLSVLVGHHVVTTGQLANKKHRQRTTSALLDWSFLGAEVCVVNTLAGMETLVEHECREC
eukprot:36386-Amphidinium_carterae.1